MAFSAVIFDVDGTLVDTNPTHVEAWQRAFARGDFSVPKERIASEIGKGGDMLVPSILGEADEQEHGDELREYCGEEFLRLASQSSFTVFPGAPELMKALRERGVHVALATSAKREYLEAIEKSAGMDLQSLADVVITSDDAENSKPEPDLINAAIEKLGRAPHECVMVGDTPHDAEASKRAGILCFGVLTGGHTAETLIQAGAVRVWNDADDLLMHLDEALQMQGSTRS